MVDVSESILTDCKNWLIEQSQKWHTGVCHGKTLYFDGEDAGEEVAHNHQYCHSWVGYAYHHACGVGADWSKKPKKNARNFLTLTCHSKIRSKDVCSPEACDFLILWMAKGSPFSQFILNRDDETSLTEGGAILLCGPDGLTIAQAYWVCKVLRFITEGAKAAETFMKLVKGGVDPMLAVYIASQIRTIKGATFGYTGVAGHSTVIDPENTDVIGMMQRNFNRNAPTTSKVFTRDKKAIPKGFKADVNALTKVQGFCKPFKKSDGWGGFIEGKGADEEELIRRVLEWQSELSVALDKPVSTAKSPTENLDLDLD